jgi:hypothetical protein
MMSTYFNNRNVQGWIAEVESDDLDRQDAGIWSLGEMVRHHFPFEVLELYQAGQAVSQATYSAAVGIRVRAYGTVGMIGRQMMTKMAQQTAFERNVTQGQLRRILESCYQITSSLLSRLPEIVDAVAAGLDYVPERFDELVDKLTQQLKSMGTAEDKANIRRALDYIRVVRGY